TEELVGIIEHLAAHAVELLGLSGQAHGPDRSAGSASAIDTTCRAAGGSAGNPRRAGAPG
ncbi:hypothetical protein, partial [Massilia phosphatilytica]